MAGAPPKSFSTPAEAKAAMVVMVDILSSNRAQLLKLLEGQDTQQKKIAAIMPEMQKLLAPEMTKLGFPPGPMGLMMGFAAFKKASTELEGCAVIQKAIDMLQGAMMNGAVKDEAEIQSLLTELKA